MREVHCAAATRAHAHELHERMKAIEELFRDLDPFDGFEWPEPEHAEAFERAVSSDAPARRP